MDGKEVYTGVARPAGVGVEATLVQVPEMDDDYILTGWVDLSGMPAGTQVQLCIEMYVAAGQQRPSSLCAEYSAPGDAALVHVKPMYIPRWGRARLTVTVTRGEVFDIPYWIAAVKPDIGVKAWLMRRFA